MSSRFPILITGGKGLLGAELTQHLKSRSRDQEIVSLGRDQLDITDSSAVAHVFADLKPSAVINAAAFTDVDGAEDKRDVAIELNVSGPSLLAQYCSQLDIPLVHFSTDYVFAGDGKSPLKETDETRPLNFYGATKLGGEKAVLMYARGLVLRVQWLYGEKRDRFSTLGAKASFTPLTDQFGAPTWTVDIADWTVQLLDRKASGLFHATYDDYGSWFDVYQFVKEQTGVKTELVPSTLTSLSLPARRPSFAVLSNEKLKKELGVASLGSWKPALKAFLHKKGLS